jgi:hypothetical protein
MLAHGSIYNFVGTGPVRTYFCNNTRSFYGEMRARLPAMALRALCTEPVPTGRNMTLAQLCCTCWALAALAELGVQGPESSYRPVKFSCCGMDCHVPGEPKKVWESCSFWRAEPDLSGNVRLSDCLIYSEKGYPVVVADMHLDRLFPCSQSGYIWFWARIIYFFCRNIVIPEKPFANAKVVIIWIYPVLNENYFSLLLEYTRVRKLWRKWAIFRILIGGFWL